MEDVEGKKAGVLTQDRGGRIGFLRENSDLETGEEVVRSGPVNPTDFTKGLLSTQPMGGLTLTDEMHSGTPDLLVRVCAIPIGGRTESNLGREPATEGKADLSMAPSRVSLDLGRVQSKSKSYFSTLGSEIGPRPRLTDSQMARKSILNSSGESICESGEWELSEEEEDSEIGIKGEGGDGISDEGELGGCSK
jgi:hypothetical protein